MNYIIALLIPPLALLFSGKIFHAIFNALLLIFSLIILVGTLGFGSPIAWFMWVLAIIHAIFVVHGKRSDDQLRRVLKSIDDT